MARSRILDPGFFTNEDLLELPLEARVLFAGLWCLADREGRLEDRPKRIKIELFPGDNYDVDMLLQALLSRGFIHRYAVPGTNLIHVKHFLKYQRCHPREAQSVWPKCPCETEMESLGDAKDQPRTDLGSAKVSGLGSPRTKGSPMSPEVSSEDAPEVAEANVGSPLPKRILTPAIVEDRREKNPDLDVDAELLKFRNHPWKKPPRDYVAAFDNWLTNARKYAAERNGNGTQLRTNPQQNRFVARTSPGTERLPDMVIGD